MRALERRSKQLVPSVISCPRNDPGHREKHFIALELSLNLRVDSKFVTETV
jgi:hypothetical protein